MNRNELTEDESYQGLFNLVRHSQYDCPIGIFWIIVSAVFHLRTLEIAGYFKKEDKSTKSGLSRNQLFIGAVFVDFLQLLRYNTHSILAQAVRIQGRWRWVHRVRICAPNILASSKKYSHFAQPFLGKVLYRELRKEYTP